MYSGSTIRPLTGRIIGSHQKINRLARTRLRNLLEEDQRFPSSKLILHFEGVNGPDAIKRKSPARDEPWHYYDPFDEDDRRLLDIMDRHYDDLVNALKQEDEVRAAFEAAWLAHAIVDGLTPAHHYPYEEKLVELRGGKGIETRNTIKDKLIMPGQNGREMLRNNWKMWGPGGLLTSHGLFEWGVALMIAPLGNKGLELTNQDLDDLHKYGALGLFRRKAKEIAAVGAYDQYLRTGWTPMLARRVRDRVVPAVIKTVALAWYAAAIDSGITKGKKK